MKLLKVLSLLASGRSKTTNIWQMDSDIKKLLGVLCDFEQQTFTRSAKRTWLLGLTGLIRERGLPSINCDSILPLFYSLCKKIIRFDLVTNIDDFHHHCWYFTKCAIWSVFTDYHYHLTKG